MQEIISLWSLWDRYKEDAADTASSAFAEGGSSASGPTKSHRVGRATGLAVASSAAAALIPSVMATSHDDDGDDDDITGHGQEVGGGEEGAGGDTVVVTPAMLSNLLVKMREACMASIVGQVGGQNVDGVGINNMGKAANKVLERTQAAG